MRVVVWREKPQTKKQKSKKITLCSHEISPLRYDKIKEGGLSEELAKKFLIN